MSLDDKPCSCTLVQRGGAAQTSRIELNAGLHLALAVLQDGTQGGLFFSYCNNLTVRNATVYYNFTQNPWYQATITDMSPSGLTWNITVSTSSSHSQESCGFICDTCLNAS